MSDRVRSSRRVDDEGGVALVVALGGLLAVTAVALSVSVVAAVETQVASGARWREEALAHAEAAIELTCAALAGEADWNAVLAGSRVTELPGASRTPDVAGWGAIDLEILTGRLQASSDASTVWGANAARWRLYVHGRPDELFVSPSASAAPYVAVWVADDDADDDGDPERDLNGSITLRAEAFGAGRAHQVILATVRRLPHGTDVVSWRLPADRQ